MTVTDLMRVTALATLIVSSASSATTAQTTGVDPHHPNPTLAQAAPGQAPSVQPAQPGTAPAELGMVRPGMMGHGMMAGMPMMGPRGHMMKVMFAVIDTNGDGALSFEEVMAVHKRIFDRIDANKDGKVTLEEMQTFMREQQRDGALFHGGHVLALACTRRIPFGSMKCIRTAAEAYAEQRGVCRDYAHLALAFCRCLNIPARYCTGYISDIGLPPPYAPMDFAAWIEVFLGGRWHTFDLRNKTRGSVAS